MQSHELANLFPMMSNEELNTLVEDMRINGYDATSPIVLYQKKILDGRNRYKAAQVAKVEPVFVTFNHGGDPLKFVIRANLHRRHLNETQRAGVAAKMANMPSHRPNKSANLPTSNLCPLCGETHDGRCRVTQTEAAKDLNVSARTVRTYKAVAAAMPELVEKMDSGDMTAHEASKKVRETKRVAARAEIALAGAKVPPSDHWQLFHGDFRELGMQIPDNSIDLIFTDPPYPGEFIELWSDLAKFANRVLKPSGFLCAYSGQLHLPEVYRRLSEHLIYYWTFDLVHSGSKQLIMPRNIFCGWKPILIYQKAPFHKIQEGIEDTIIGSGREKELHDWQQAEREIDIIINRMTLPGQVICDPFAGSGTTLAAAAKLNRQPIGFEIDKTTYLLAKKRVHDAIQSTI